MRDQDHFKRMLAQGVSATQDPRSALERVTELAAANTIRCPNCSNTVEVPDSSRTDTNDVETNDENDPDEFAERCPFCGFDLGPYFQSFWACEFASKYSQEQRDKAAKEGAALKDGSFPIYDQEDVNNADNLKGNGKAAKSTVEGHIRKRVQQLNLKLPDSMKS